ncbi:MAG: VOC family protein [Gemmatimonadaceae bacterium]|nr:VOC family protein [Gemmatimonadaceae bacterium]
MGATTNDLFGAATTAEPATPGSYGEAPAGYRLPDATRLGKVRLQVADLARSLAFYERTLGMRVVERDAASASLAAHGASRVLVELEERKGVRPAGRGLLGLYHFAILLPDRPSLGRFVRHLAEIGARAGAGDHLVSEALYLTDPDGLGIVVYADRPRSSWQRLGRELMISTDPVDMADLAASAGDTRWSGMPAGTTIGHVHLHVGSLAQGSAFFSDALGFDRMTWRYPGALFLGAGGYHHHLGTNVWAGPGARQSGNDDARLLEWTIELPSADDVALATRSIRAAGHDVDETQAGETLTQDPWGTRIRLRVPTDEVKS